MIGAASSSTTSATTATSNCSTKPSRDSLPQATPTARLSTAQFLGDLAKDSKSGDDIRRLGFEIHGSISQTVTGPKGGDVDVYSFRGTAGSVVWFDIDRTAQGLDSVVELIDANGAVVARSNNSLTEQTNPVQLVGIAQPMQAGFAGSSGPFTNPDFYSTNPLDAGMRVILPGTEGVVNTYFVRVRSNSSDLARLTGGLSQGEYVMQIRLQNLDEFPGSTVRYADIRYATTGIEVIGKPAHSPLLGDSADTSSTLLPNNTFETAQYLGNLLTSDRNEVSVAGNIANRQRRAVVLARFELRPDPVHRRATATRPRRLPPCSTSSMPTD